MKAYAGYVYGKGVDTDFVIVEDPEKVDTRMKKQFGQDCSYEISEVDIYSISYTQLNEIDIENLSQLQQII